MMAGIILATGRTKPGQTYEEFAREMSSYFRTENPVKFAERPNMPYFWQRQNLRKPEEKALAFAHTFLGVRIAGRHVRQLAVVLRGLCAVPFSLSHAPVLTAERGERRGAFRQQVVVDAIPVRETAHAGLADERRPVGPDRLTARGAEEPGDPRLIVGNGLQTLGVEDLGAHSRLIETRK